METVSLPESLVIVRHPYSVQNAALDLLNYIFDPFGSKRELELPLNYLLENLGIEEILTEIDTLRECAAISDKFVSVYLSENPYIRGKIDKIRKVAIIPDADIWITNYGVWQAIKTGNFLAKKDPFDVCISSEHTRNLQMDAYFDSQFKYKYKTITDERLRERNFGIFHGLTDKEIKKRDPTAYDNWNRLGRYSYRPPGGENYPDVERRVKTFLEELSKNYGGKNILVLTHQITQKMFKKVLEDLNEEKVLKLQIPNCGIHEYKHCGNKMKLEFNGKTYTPEHYEPDYDI